MAVKTENTMAEGLQSIMQDLATLKMTPDADLKLIVDVETMILNWLKSGMANAAQQPGGGIQGGMNMGPGPQDPNMMGIDPSRITGGDLAGRAMMNAPGPMMSSGPPPMDEARRMMSR